jgi:hypothetical protein
MAIFAFAIVAKLPIVSTQIIVLGRRDNHYTMETVYIHCIIITHQLIDSLSDEFQVFQNDENIDWFK